MGSFPYVAPEQMLDMREADVRADVYALGKLLPFLTTGQMPVAPVEKADLGRYRYFVFRCCEYDRDDRYQDVVKARSAFEMVANGVLRPMPPREVVRTLLESDVALTEEQELELLEIFDTEPDDLLLHTRWLPELPDDTLRRFLSRDKARFGGVLEIYDEAIASRGSLDWDYCDIVADFYRRIYRATDDSAIQ
jgi:serine/threonine protein kinase